jgi:hypothetical protein
MEMRRLRKTECAVAPQTMANLDASVKPLRSNETGTSVLGAQVQHIESSQEAKGFLNKQVHLPDIP